MGTARARADSEAGRMIHHGAEAIAKRLCLSERQVYRLSAEGHLPFVVKVGNKLAASETAIAEFFKEKPPTRETTGGK